MQIIMTRKLSLFGHKGRMHIRKIKKCDDKNYRSGNGQ